MWSVDSVCSAWGWVIEHRATFWLGTCGFAVLCSDIWAMLCVSAHWPGSISRQCAGSSPSVGRLSMDNSSSFSSQPRSFLFLLEPIRASTEKAWALELRAAADRLLSLISHKIHPKWGEAAKNPLRPSNAAKQNNQKIKRRRRKNAHVSVYSGSQTHQVSKVIPTVTRNAATNFWRTVSSWQRGRTRCFWCGVLLHAFLRASTPCLFLSLSPSLLSDW